MPSARKTSPILRDLDLVTKLKPLIISQGRAIFGHKFTPDHVIDVIVEKAGYYLPSDDSADGSVDDGVEYAEYFTAHLIIYPKLVAPKRGGTVLHTNPNENCETLVDVMTDLLDSLFERAECIKYTAKRW